VVQAHTAAVSDIADLDDDVTVHTTSGQHRFQALPVPIIVGEAVQVFAMHSPQKQVHVH
jgi:hypothetical protein